jgi:hypothetical protein
VFTLFSPYDWRTFTHDTHTAARSYGTHAPPATQGGGSTRTETGGNELVFIDCGTVGRQTQQTHWRAFECES